jgi:uncharacterized protein YuzE
MTAGAMYVYINEGAEIVRQIEVNDGITVDVDGGGAIVGVELLTPGAQCRSVSEFQQTFAYLESSLGLDHDSAAMIGYLCVQAFPQTQGRVDMAVPQIHQESQPVPDLVFS